jgi:acyl transferase domain-containing protein/phosphopantetheinyl transferase (holo-ACP synthase)
MTGMASGTQTAGSRDVAIVGMACVFPGAADVAEYWQNILSKVDAVGDPPDDWDADRYYEPGSTANDRVYCKRGGWLGDLARFDPLAHGVMPASVDGGEPDQFLALEVAHRALIDAAVLDRDIDRSRVGVIIGRGTYINRAFTTVVQHGVMVDQVLRILRQLHPEHTDADMQALKRDLKASLPPFNADVAPGLVPNVMSGRIANRLDLNGPNYTIDAACASSLVAVDHAMQELNQGRCDVMLAGGVHATTPAPILQIFCQLEALSRSGQIRPFDADADGTLLGEGLGFVVLKRRDDAERDGDRIYALIKSVGTASDGRAQGLLAPRIEGQELALRRAYDEAGLDPRTVELLEAHGTGTPVGDAAELEALRRVLGPPEPVGPTVAVGSVKSMISHLIPAAGIAGLIKAALALHHKVLPPTLHCERPHPAFAPERSRLYLNSEPRPWIHGLPQPRRAGVSAFGFGGINAHAVLEEYAADEKAAPSLGRQWPSEVLILDGDSREDLSRQCDALRGGICDDSALLGFVLRHNRTTADDPAHRVAIVAASPADLAGKLARAAEALRDGRRRQINDRQGVYYTEEPLGRSGRVAFLFPGEGSQYAGMLADTAVAFPEVRRWFDLLDAAFNRHERQFPPSRAVYPPPGVPVDPARLWGMDVGPEVLFAASQGLLDLLRHLGITPHAAVGHSSGEYSALVAAGVISVADDQQVAAKVLELNSRYERLLADGQVPRGTLLTVGGVSPEKLKDTISRAAGRLTLAMDNCPSQVVLCGDDAVVSSAEKDLAAAGGLCERLPLDRAYHTELFQAFAGQVAGYLAGITLSPPRIDLYSCSSAGRFPADENGIRALASGQWATCVRFRQTVQAMYNDGVRIFVEIGPRGNLTAFVNDILRGTAHLALPSDDPRGGLTQLNHAVAQLAVHRVPVRLEHLYARRRRAEASRPSGPRSSTQHLATGLQPMRLTAQSGPDGTRTEDSAVTPGLRVDAGAAEPGRAGFAPGPREASASRAVQEHLRTMERFLDVEQQVLQSFLMTRRGEAPDAPAATDAGQAMLSLSQGPATSAGITGVSEPGNAENPPDATVSAASEVDIAGLIRQLLSERTGYPEDLLADELDLEADLGIDSVKRVEIIGAVQQRTRQLSSTDLAELRRLRTLREIIAFLSPRLGPHRVDESPASESDGRPAEPRPDDSCSRPFLDEMIVLERGQKLVASVRLDLQQDVFLADHTIERQRPASLDPGLVGLPVVPLTVSLEILAEAAAKLAEGGVVTAIRDVRAYRWITVDSGQRRLTVTATRADGGEVLARLDDGEDDPTPGPRRPARSPLVEAIVRIAPSHEQPPARPRPAQAQRPRTADSLYGPDGMFHGPAFQVVQSLDGVADMCATATLRSRPAAELFTSRRADDMVLDPALLDGPGQVVAFWLAERSSELLDIFPVSLAALELFARPPSPGSLFRCDVQVRELQRDRLLSDIDVVDETGHVTARFTGWQDVRLDLPAPLRRFLSRPRDAFLGEVWQPPITSPQPPGSLHGRWLATLPPVVHDHGALWLRALAYAVLSAAERHNWQQLAAAAPKRRTEWLLGRIAAKEAVRDFIAERHGVHLSNADVTVIAKTTGEPLVTGQWAQSYPAPLVTIAHTEGVAVAVAADPAAHNGVGVDIQRVGSVTAEVKDLAFHDAESRLVNGREQSTEWITRIWCAKEAVVKAVAGISLSPWDVEATGLYGDTVALRFAADHPPACRDIPDGEARAATRVDGDLACALCWLPVPKPSVSAPITGEGEALL